MITTEDLRRSLGIDAAHFDDDRAQEAVDEVDALAKVYAGGSDVVDALDADAEEALRQVVKRYARRVYSNPEGVLHKNIQQAVTTTYADSSEAAHGLNRHLRRAVRSAIRGATAKTPLYASEAES